MTVSHRPEPLALPRQLLRRAAAVLAGVLVAALVLGLWRMGDDIDDEVDAAATLARVSAQLAALAALDDEQALASMRELLAGAPLRHLHLELSDAEGRLRLVSTPAAGSPLLAPLVAWHRRWSTEADAPAVQWSLPRPSGPDWTVRLQARRDSERAEALAGQLATLGLLALAAMGILLVVAWSVGRAFAPLHALLQAIARIEQADTSAVAALPTMPVHELERVAQALRHLGRALEAAESDRRSLGQRVITLQEDERARLARELHDEFGQHLAALRVDASWLRKRLAGDAPALQVLQSIDDHGRRIQDELRTVLARLRPLQGLDDGGLLEAASLRALLRSLVQGWSAQPQSPLRVELACTGWLAADDGPRVPSALALALYRITQESLSNAARHAGATCVRVGVHGDGRDAAATIDWSVQDDGRGLPDADRAMLRGSGLAGMRERIWALGAELTLAPADAGSAERPGLTLAARFVLG